MEPMKKEPQATLTKAERTAVVRRALAAYFADPTEHGWPDAPSCSVVRRAGLNYAVVVDAAMETLAVYRLRRELGTTGAGQLKRLKRPPGGLA